MITIGVTGSVGTGKSTVCQMFEKLGAFRLDADTLAHEALEKGRPPHRRVLRHFGERILRRSGKIDRARLAQEVFSHPRQLDFLCRVVHPYVIQRMRQGLRAVRKKDPDATVVAEVPLLFEAGLESMFDLSVTVVCDAKTQRVRSRHKGLSALQVRLRKRAQWSLAKKRKRSDRVINNQGSLRETARQVRLLWEALQSGRSLKRKNG